MKFNLIPLTTLVVGSFFGIKSSYTNNIYDCTFIYMLCLLTGVLFWVNPINGYFLYIDVIVVQIALWYHTYLAIKYEHYNYILYNLLFCFLFPISCYYYSKGKILISYLLHSLMHICVIINTIDLYNHIYKVKYTKHK